MRISLFRLRGFGVLAEFSLDRISIGVPGRNEFVNLVDLWVRYGDACRCPVDLPMQRFNRGVFR